MEYEKRTYFRENEEESVNGFIVVGHVHEQKKYHVTEKWEREDKEDTWVDYHIKESKLMERISNDEVEHVGVISHEKFEEVLEAAEPSGKHEQITPAEI